ERSEILQAQINADFSGSGRKIVGHLAHEVQIPAPGRVLAEAARADVGGDRAREPETVAATKERHRVAIHLQRTGALERHPAQRPLRPTADTPARAALSLVAAAGEVLAHVLHGVAVQAELSTRPSC